MAKSNNNLEQFITAARTQHLPRSDRFEVQFYIPPALTGSWGNTDADRISLMCEEAQIPGLAATNLPIKIGPWTEYRTQNLEYLSTDMTFTFVVDEQWSGRTFFEDWMAVSAHPNTKELAFYNDIVAQVTVSSLSINNDIMAVWLLEDCVPKVINLTPVSWGNTAKLRMGISMSAKRWVRLYDQVGVASTDEYKSRGRTPDRSGTSSRDLLNQRVGNIVKGAISRKINDLFD